MRCHAYWRISNKKYIHLVLFFLFWIPVIECDVGTYGQNCKNTCGFCSGPDLCHFANGTCRNGCESGYHGQRCNQGKCLLWCISPSTALTKLISTVISSFHCVTYAYWWKPVESLFYIEELYSLLFYFICFVLCKS